MDEERVTDPQAFTSDLTAQALRRWTRVRAEVTGKRSAARIEMNRGRGRTGGVTLEVSGDVGDAASIARIRDTIAASLSRGGFSWSKEPVLGPNGAQSQDLDSALARAHAKRESTVLAVALLAGFLTAVVAFFGGGAVARAITGDQGQVGGRILGFVVGIGLCIAVVLLRQRIFPAVEIAAVTPGRRILQRITGGLSVGTLISAGAQIVGRIVG
jgi:hypothetical protein